MNIHPIILIGTHEQAFISELDIIVLTADVIHWPL